MFFLCMRNVFTPNRNKTVFTSNVNSGLQYNTIQYNTIQYNTIQYNTNLISFLFYAIIFSLNKNGGRFVFSGRIYGRTRPPVSSKGAFL